MTLQNWYYALAITNSILWLVLLLLIIGLLLKLYFTIKSAPERMQNTLSSLFQQNKREIVTMAGMTAFTVLATALRKWISRK